MEPAADRPPSGAISPSLAASLAAILCLFAIVTAYAQPAWWNSRGAVLSTATPNDFSVANEGQLKQFTFQAVKEMNAHLPGGAGASLNALVTGWLNDYATNHYSASNPKPSDFQAMNAGQLKYIGGMIWTRLVAAGYTNTLPSWLDVTATDSQAVNLGQLKTVFNFDLTFRSSGNGSSLPDWWLNHYFGGLTVNGTAINPTSYVAWSGSTVTLQQAYQQNLNPIDYYAGAVPTLGFQGGTTLSSGGGTASVLVTDQYGDPLVGAPISFSIDYGALAAPGSSSVAQTVQVESGTDGLASVVVAPPWWPGTTYTVTAQAVGQGSASQQASGLVGSDSPNYPPVPATQSSQCPSYTVDPSTQTTNGIWYLAYMDVVESSSIPACQWRHSVGAGETMTLTIQGLPANVSGSAQWAASGGTIQQADTGQVVQTGTGPSIIFTAGITSGSETVTATISGGATMSTSFLVETPTGVTATYISSEPFIPGYIGAGMYVYWTIQPTDVSFGNIMVAERTCPATGTTGMFGYGAPAHNPNGKSTLNPPPSDAELSAYTWVNIRADNNSTTSDWCSLSNIQVPQQLGASLFGDFEWDIPFVWDLQSDRNNANSIKFPQAIKFPQTVKATFAVTADGTVTVTKVNASDTRSQYQTGPDSVNPGPGSGP